MAQHIEQCRPGVLDVDVQRPSSQRRVADTGTAQTEASLDLQLSVTLDELGDQFPEDLLFGEVLRADLDGIPGVRRRGHNRAEDSRHNRRDPKQTKAHCLAARHCSSSDSN